MSDEPEFTFVAIVFIIVIAAMMFLNIYIQRAKTEKATQITVLQTQLADAKESQRHADMKFNLCMRQLK